MLNSALMLPGPECLDIQHGLNEGIFDREHTEIIAVERDVVAAADMQIKLDRLGVTNQSVWVDELHTLSLVETRGPGNLDFAYLDFCGSLTAAIFSWINDQLAPSLHVGSQVSLTFCRKPRRNGLMIALRDHEVFENNSRADQKFIKETREELATALADGQTIEDISDAVMRTVLCFKASFRPCRIAIRYFENYDGENGTPMSAIRVEVLDMQAPSAVPKPLFAHLDGILAEHANRTKLTKLDG